MDSDPLIRKQIDADLAARLQRVTARTPHTTASASRPPTFPPVSPPSPRPAPGSTALRSTPPPPPPPPGAAPARKKRRHPARHSRSAALALSFVTTSGLAYAFATTDGGASATTAAPAGVVTSPSVAPSPTATAPTTTPTTTPAAAPTTAATTVPTTAPVTAPAAPTVVNGTAFSNRYGNVQVQATFASDGSLTNIDVIQVPSRDRESVQINNYAIPRLNSEALTAQSANVHTVSGATYTSNGYAQSLQSAIDVARANGITTIS